VAGVIELVGGLRLLTRWAAFICSGEMAVAYFMMHQPRGLLPIANQGELAALFAFVFLLIAARGPGPWSLDATRGASAEERRSSAGGCAESGCPGPHLPAASSDACSGRRQ